MKRISWTLVFHAYPPLTDQFTIEKRNQLLKHTYMINGPISKVSRMRYIKVAQLFGPPFIHIFLPQDEMTMAIEFIDKDINVLDWETTYNN